MRPSASNLAPLLFLLTLIGHAAPALAQNPVITISAIGSRTVAAGAVTPYASAADCAGNVTFRTDTVAQYDIWRSGVGSSCQDSTVRSSTTNTTCTWATHVTSVTSNEFTVPISSLMNGNTAACTAMFAASVGTTFEFTILKTDTSMDVSSSMNFAKVSLRIDASAPQAVTIAEGDTHRLGESVTVRYTAATGEMEQISFRTYIDTAGTCTEDGTPSSTALVPGEVPASSLTYKSSADSLTPGNTGSAIGSSIVVAVAPVDIAGNVGKLSPLICVSFVETIGFCEEGDVECNENCAVHAPGRSGGAPYLLLSALASLAVVVHARRRRSAK